MRRGDYVFVMDNVRTHKALAVEDLLKEITVCYTAPYSPFLNPIEELFSTWKHYFRILMHNQDGSVVSNICASSLRLTQKKIIGY